MLGSAPLSPEKLAAHAKGSSFGAILAVFGTLLCYAYLFTTIADPFEIPRPEVIAEKLGVEGFFNFDSHDLVTTKIRANKADRFNNRDERSVLFAAVALGFLFVYLAPVRWKRPLLVAAFFAGMCALYPPLVIAGFLASHLLVYQAFHRPPPKVKTDLPFVTGVLLFVAYGAEPLAPRWPLVGIGALLAGGAAVVGMRVVGHGGRLNRVWRPLVVHAAMATAFVGAAAHGFTQREFELPVGVILYFWQWERLIMYYQDVKEGRTPDELPLITYLSVFCNPGSMNNMNWDGTIALGYTYNTQTFLRRHKTDLVWSGVKIWWVALLYALFGRWFVGTLMDLFETVFQVELYRSVSVLVRNHVARTDVSTATVLLSCLLHNVNWWVLRASLQHFRVGIWRVSGYDVEPDMNKVWKATNLVNLWPRLTFHYVQLLIRVFYYPVFFRLKKLPQALRITVSIFAAAAFGNMIFFHVVPHLNNRGRTTETLWLALADWPYYVLLAAGISLCEIYVFYRSKKKKQPRKAWTLDRWLGLDVACMLASVTFFSLIHVFYYQSSRGDFRDHLNLFLRGLGLS